VEDFLSHLGESNS